MNYKSAKAIREELKRAERVRRSECRKAKEFARIMWNDGYYEYSDIESVDE